MAPQRTGVFSFDGIVVDLKRLEVTRDGERIDLEPKALRVLFHLIENRNRVVTKEELIAAVWAGTFVTDNALTRVIAQIRKQLGDSARSPRFIETVATAGYRFIADVAEEAAAAQAPLISAKPRRGRMAVAVAGVMAIGASGWWLGHPRTDTPHIAGLQQITSSAAADLWPSFSPDGSQIAFSSDRTGRFEIYIRSLAPGSAERQITSDGESNIEPAWSPNGRYLAYVPRQHGGIKIIPASGGPTRDLTDTGDSPQWSPNGRTLVIRLFSRNVNPLQSTSPVDTGPILALINAEGGPATPLTDKGATPFNPEYPNWLADGHHIVFASVSPGALRSEHASLWVVDSESRTLHDIRAGTFPEFPVFSPDGRDLYFVDEAAKVPGIWHARAGRDWKIESAEPLIPSEGARPRDLAVSADGSRIAFSRLTGESAIWSVSLDLHGATAGEPKPLIRDRSFRNLDAHFSADGSKIAWNSVDADREGVIYVSNADGSSAEAVTPAGQNSGRPQWVGRELTLAYQVQRNGEWSYWVAPLQGRPERVNSSLDLKHADRLRLSSDGTMLAAHVSTPGGLQVVVTPLRGGAVRALTPAARNIGFPCWSPDGRWIAAQENTHGDSTLVVIPSAGGEIRTIASEFTQYFSYDWSPDSDRISFAGLRDGVWNIYWISVSTGKVEQLTHFTAQSGFVRYASWSPKGDRILFERDDLTSNIYVADLSSPDK